MSRAQRRFALATLAAVALSVAAPVAAQAPRVVVERFSGPGGAGLRQRLVEDLVQNGLVVVPEAEVQRAERAAGRPSTSAEYVALARELRASAFVEGRVRRQRRRQQRLQVRVRNGLDGEVLGATGWSGRNASALAVVGREGHARLARWLSEARAPGPATASASLAAPATGDVPWWQRRDAGGADPEEPPERAEETPRPAATRYDAFRIAVLGGTLFRSSNTTVTVYASQRGLSPPDPSAALIEESRRYQSGGIGHFELGGRFEIYPGAFDQAQSFPWLGLVAELTHSIGVASNGFDRRTGDPVAVPTNQFELYVGGRFRHRFGPARSEPELHIDAGWGSFNFNLDLDRLQQIELDTIIPPMQHGYLQLALGIEVGVAPGYLTLGLEAGGRVGTNIGGDTRNVWGTDTSPSNGLLVGALLKLEIPEAQGLFFAVNVRYFLFATDFRGQVGCAVAEECAGFMNPWEDRRLWEVWPVQAPGGGAPDLDAVVGGPSGPVIDHYVRLQLAIGYAFY
ncbi:MAG: hypothetical protein KF729_36665 [Sandaracinaceae bacterium]|nr:hypothetical protein [Sandaracinaceae bacterium]